MKDVRFFENGAVLENWAHDLNNTGISGALIEVAETRVLPDAHQALSHEASFTLGGPDNKWKIWETNETDIPFSRSGTLIRSIKVHAPLIDEFGLVVFVYADTDEAPYARNLLTGDNRQGKKWKFLPDRPYYLPPSVTKNPFS